MSGTSADGPVDEHRRQVLTMLSEGKISVQEAERLLNALREPSPADDETARRPEHLRVVVEGTGEKPEHVDVRVPLSLIRAGIKTGMKFQELMPAEARAHVEAKLSQKGIKVEMPDLKPEDIEQLVGALADLRVELDDKDGEKVRVFCE